MLYSLVAIILISLNHAYWYWYWYWYWLKMLHGSGAYLVVST